jgi:hypothetical protein
MGIPISILGFYEELQYFTVPSMEYCFVYST